MTGLEVSLIIIGILCICVSFFVSRRSSAEAVETPASGARPAAEVWTEKDEQIVRQRMQELMQEMQAEYIEEAKGEMGRLCNEKIMAVDEFAGPILEKINNNHQEVVFMYNMLNEKQKELRTLMAERPEKDNAAAPSSGIKAEAVKKQTERTENTASAGKKLPGPEANAASALEKMAVSQAASLQGAQKTAVQTGLSQVKNSASKKAAHRASAGSANHTKTKTVLPPESAAVEPAAVGQRSEDVNLQIQKMHKEGKSILEISKALDIGQGEVKLIIALYGGRKK